MRWTGSGAVPVGRFGAGNVRGGAFRRGLYLGLFLMRGRSGVTVYELARELGVSHATAKRYLIEVETLAPLRRERERRGPIRYSLGEQ